MAVTTAISQSTPKKSWADIVKGRSESKVEPLRPAARGTHRCLCTGEFLVMLGHYGWIRSLIDIDHSEADRHGGRIYLRASDLRPGCTPKQGDEVTFFLYADENGLGAEDCFATHDPHPPQQPTLSRRQGYSRPKTNWGNRMHQTVTKKCTNSLRAEASEFVPTVLVPIGTGGEDFCSNNLRAEASEFVPAPPGLGPSLDAEATEFVPMRSSCKDSQHMYFNAKRFYDDDTDSDSDVSTADSDDFSGRVLVAPGLSACFVDKPEQWSDLSSFEDDDDDETDENAWAAVSARCAKAVGQVHHEHPWHVRNAAARAKLTALPPGFQAPPGLAHPPGLA